MLTMPIDILVCVMEHLEPQDLCSVAQTCSVPRTHTTRAHTTHKHA
jgi:hypothetical protein